jgi:O-antigen/teichoic acid export membrane protein
VPSPSHSATAAGSETTPLLAGLARNASTQFAARALGVLAQGLGLILVARHLGPASYGAFALVSSLTLMAMVLADWGLLLVGARAVATRPDEEDRILRACLSLRLALGVAAWAVLVALSFAGTGNGRVHVAAVVAGVSFLPGAWFAIGHIRAQVELRMERVALPLLLGSLLSVAWLVTVVLLNGDVVALAGSFVIAAVASAALCAAMTHGLPLRPRGDRVLWRSLMIESTPVALGAICVTIYFYVDALLLARLSTSAQLGLYDSAYRFVQLAPLVPTVLVTSVFALAARHADEDRDRMRLFVRELGSLIALLLPIAPLLLATAPTDLVTLLYGPGYRAAGPLLALLSAVVVLMILTGVIGPLLVALGRERSTLVIAAVSAVLNIAVNLVLIPVWDARGAAVATLITEVVALGAAGVLLHRTLHPTFDAVQLLKVTIAGVGGAAVVLVLPAPVLVRLAAGLVVYAAALLLLRAVGRRTLELTRAVPSTARALG